MGIMLEQGLASAVRYIQDIVTPGTKTYFDDLPERFYVPSIYFPAPLSVGDFATLQSRCMEYAFECWFMASSNWDACMEANKALEHIMIDGCLIPIVDQDGSKTGKHLRITKPKTRKIDDGIFQLSFFLKEYFRSDNNSDKLARMVIEDYKRKE